jgi:hypothetical protein
MMFCGNVVGKHCSKERGDVYETVRCAVDMYWLAVQ